MNNVRKNYMKKRLNGLLTLLATALMVACDAHIEEPDMAVKVGHVLCTDGQSLSYESYDGSGKEAIAIVFYLNRDPGTAGNGYAVYLHDLPAEAFADSIGVAQGTSADLTAYDGNENTFALYDTEEVASPIAERVFDLWRYGQSAYIPSAAQMRLLYAAKALVNPYIENAGASLCPTRRTTAGIGRVPRWKGRKRPRRGSIPWAAVPCRRPRSGRRTRCDPSSRSTSDGEAERHIEMSGF